MYRYETFPDRPKVDMRAFWEFDKEAMDWHAAYKTIIHRIIEYLPEDQWPEMVAFYGLEKVKQTLLTEIYTMAKYAIDKAAKYFDLDKEDMRSYKHHMEDPNVYKYWRR